MFGFAKTSWLALIVLQFNGIEALFGLGKLLDANQDVDFPVYWNVPTAMCHRHGMLFKEVSCDFCMLQNSDDVFRGEKIVVFYDPGSFPAIFPNETVRNDGLPQKGNLHRHLEDFTKIVDEHIPDKSFSGLAVIDFERWRPVYRQHWNALKSYQNQSEKIVETEYPELKGSAQKEKATKQFERMGKIFMEVTLKTAKELRPKAAWGYYGFPLCFNVHGSMVENNCNPKVLEENDNISWLFAAEDVILPSVYLHSNLSIKDNIKLIRGRIIEALRISKKFNPRKKVLGYFSYGYTDRKDVFLNREVFVNGVREMIDLGVDGYIIWGSSFDLNTKEKCEKFRDYVKDILGPAVVETKAMAKKRNDCARTSRVKIQIGSDSKYLEFDWPLR